MSRGFESIVKHENKLESPLETLQGDVILLKDTSAISLTYSYMQLVPYLLARHPTHLSCTSFQNYAKCVEIRVHSNVSTITCVPDWCYERGRNSLQVMPPCSPHLTHTCVTSLLMYNGYVLGLLRTRLRANVFLAVACTLPLYYLRLAATNNN